MIILGGCRKGNEGNSKIESKKSEKPISETQEVNDQFQVFMDQFPKVELPLIINGCLDEILELPKLDFEISSEYSSDAKYEHIYGIIPSNGNYITTITLGSADCFIPIITTYRLNGERINSKPISIGYCGPDPCYECIESMTIKSDYRIYVADTIKTYDCDKNYNAIVGTERIKVVYKEGKLNENGVIELTEEITQKIN